MRKIFLVVFVLLCVFAFLGCNDTSETDNLRKEIDDLKTEIEEKQNKLDELKKENEDKEIKIDNLENDVLLKDKKIDELKKETEDKQNEIEDLEKDSISKDKEIEDLKINIEKVNHEYAEISNELASIIENNEDYLEILNFKNSLFKNSVNYEEYMVLKEENLLIKDNRQVEDLIDQFYYNYSKYYSVDYFSRIFESLGYKDNTSAYENIDSYITLNLQMEYNRIELYEISFFKNSVEKNSFLLRESIDVNNEDFLIGNNFIVRKPYNRGWTLEGDLEGVYNILNKYIEDNSLVSIDELKERLEEIQNENKIKYTVTAGKSYLNYEMKTFYKDNQLFANIIYLKDEEYIDDKRIYYPQSSISPEYAYKRTFVFGRVAIQFHDFSDENISELKENGIYEILEKYGKCAYDIYLENDGN